MIKYITAKKEILRYANKHRVATSLLLTTFLHLAVLWLWPTENIGQAKLLSPANVVYLTELQIANPKIVIKVKELKIDDKKIKIVDKDKPAEKVQKNTPTTTGENFLPFFEADIQPRPLIDIRSIMSYPEQARKMNIQATVVVEIDISSTGIVMKAKIVRSAGWGFDKEVLRKIRMVKFRPAMKDDLPIAVTIQIPLAFVLN